MFLRSTIDLRFFVVDVVVPNNIKDGRIFSHEVLESKRDALHLLDEGVFWIVEDSILN